MIVSYLSLKVFVIIELVELAFCLVWGCFACLLFFSPCVMYILLVQKFRSCREKETLAEFLFKNNTESEQKTQEVCTSHRGKYS